MNINTKKTKEILLGSALKDPPSAIVLDSEIVDRVTSFKLLGVTVNNCLNWNDHVSAVCAKANKRLHFLKLLKRSSVARDDLLQYYYSVIRPVIEYACPVWQSGLTVEQRDQLETIQRRAMCIITGSRDYELQCALLDVEPISVRLNGLASAFFRRICNTTDCINHLLPSERQTEMIHKLRNANKLPGIICRTERYFKSFIPYALRNYQ